MNVASLELCKKLYELSGWDDPETLGAIKSSETTGVVSTLPPGKNFYYGNRIPAYSLGYLLRKLPQSLSADADHITGDWMLKLDHPSHGWNAYYYGDLQGGVADTPEDAACKLLVELIKTGIIRL